MHTREALLDLHARSHRSLARWIALAAELPGDAARVAVAGFSYPTVLQQLHHAINAERYWLSVLEDRTDAAESEAEHASVDALARFRARVSDGTRAYLERTTDAELNASRARTIWNGEVREYVPALVILRTQTHVFQHHGEVASMVRLLGHRVPPGLDFPLD